MSLFNIFKNKKGVSKGSINEVNAVSLEKSIISLEKTIINLEKKSGYSLKDHKAKVAVVLDYSGSMDSLYRRGDMQKVLMRLMPLALKFDDNGELDVWLFTDSYKRITSLTIDNLEDYIEKVVYKSRFSMGGTSYSPVLKDVLEKYFVEEKDSSDVPTFVIFITDGENSDRNETDGVIRKSANENIFIQFVGIGNESFRYLVKLDDLEGRPVDNTGFIKVKDMNGLEDEELYNLLLDQYPDWLKEVGIK